MSRNVYPHSISYDTYNGKEIFTSPHKDILDFNILTSHKEHKNSSQVRRISKTLMVYIYILNFISIFYYFTKLYKYI